MDKPTTRLSSTIFGLGSGITDEDCTITGSRLPTNLQVLRCLMYHLEEGTHINRTKWESAKIVLAKITVFYEKANIPMISQRKSCEKMIKLLDDNAKLRAIPCNRRATPASLNKVKQMEDFLTKTFPIWPVNVEKLIKNTEDLHFLHSMKADRTATFGSHDKVLAAKAKRRQVREQLEANRHERMQNEMNISTTLTTNSSSSSDDENPGGFEDSVENVEDVDTEQPFVGPSTSSTLRTHHRTARTGTTAFIPHDIMQRPKLVALATRLKMTPTQQAAYTKAFIEEAGGDASKIANSYTTADKYRHRVVKTISNTSKEEWIPPKYATLHWDSKIMPSLTNQHVKEERLTVVVGNNNEIKFLGVPAYQLGTDERSGDIIANHTVRLLAYWHCTDSIINMTFDTTSSNTGQVTGACVTIQKQLGRALLWSACRHHVGEVILSHVFDDLKIEVSRSPDVTLFTRFRKNYSLLQIDACGDTRVPLSRFDCSSYSEKVQSFIGELRASVLEKTKSVISEGKTRDDYLEFVNLCNLYLQNELDGQTKPSFRRPGALHKARWMAKLIYSIKISLFEQQIQELPIGTITTKQQVLKVREFVNFATLIYSTWWLTCNSAVDAPWNDLQLFHSLLKYEDVNTVISKSAVRAFKNHLWYLTEEMVPLALWSTKVPAETRKAIAARMLTVKPDTDQTIPNNRFGTEFGKPKFPTTITLSTTLDSLVGRDSWFLFHLLKLDSQFFTADVEIWPECASYRESLINIQSLNVVNDCAERGVKLSSDFLAASKREDHYQNVLQVVEQNRKNQPNLRKRKKDSE